jgi:hypothetical protein
MEEYSMLTMRSLFLFAAGVASCLLFASCGKDNNPFKFKTANDRTQQYAQVTEP